MRSFRFLDGLQKVIERRNGLAMGHSRRQLTRRIQKVKEKVLKSIAVLTEGIKQKMEISMVDVICDNESKFGANIAKRMQQVMDHCRDLPNNKIQKFEIDTFEIEGEIMELEDNIEEEEGKSN